MGLERNGGTTPAASSIFSVTGNPRAPGDSTPWRCPRSCPLRNQPRRAGAAEVEPAGRALSIPRPGAPPLGRILEPVEADLRAVEEILRGSLESDFEIVRLIGKYVSEGGGKRI